MDNNFPGAPDPYQRPRYPDLWMGSMPPDEQEPPRNDNDPWQDRQAPQDGNDPWRVNLPAQGGNDPWRVSQAPAQSDHDPWRVNQPPARRGNDPWRVSPPAQGNVPPRFGPPPAPARPGSDFSTSQGDWPSSGWLQAEPQPMNERPRFGESTPLSPPTPPVPPSQPGYPFSANSAFGAVSPQPAPRSAPLPDVTRSRTAIPSAPMPGGASLAGATAVRSEFGSPASASRRSRNPLAWWYRLSSPPEPGNQATLVELERFRRARTASNIILFLVANILLSFPAALSPTNHFLGVTLSVALGVTILIIFLNRAGNVNMAGAILALLPTVGLMIGIITTPGGVNQSVLPLFDYLVMPVVLAASLLPIGWVFAFVAANAAFTIYALTTGPRTPQLVNAVTANGASIISVPILLQIVVALVAFLWVSGATRAIRRANRAEEVARLQHELAEQAQVTLLQKIQLEESIQQIVETHRRVANGDYDARVPLTERNVLWQVSGSLNNLLSRFQRLARQTSDLEKAQAALVEENARLTQALNRRSY